MSEVATLEQVDDAIASVPGWSKAALSKRPLIGGLLNSNWLVTHAGKEYFLKVFGVGSEQFINRTVSNEAASRANDIGISPRVEFFSVEKGAEVVEFLDGYRASTTADLLRKDFLFAAVALYRKLNSCENLSLTKHVFDMTDEHIDQGQSVQAIRPADFEWLNLQYSRAKEAFLASGLDLVPCHNDPMPGNFMVRMTSNDKIDDMKMIDFEFASNNERAYEIGAFLAEFFVEEPTSLELIEEYYGTARKEIVARVFAARAVADMKWGSWAVQQRRLSSWDFDYQKYGIWKYARARKIFDDPRWNDWLRQV
ncbi:choline/ethanolamine kinase--aminoglycoside phosphotransferase [Methylorubrum populi]|uniref:choline kinase family protein n=1 Tax=Methylorubrum TaxID=2282523 RepID=UPI00114E03E4|nr:choline kinase family protein [Methylorubrum populi]QDI79918.1 choline/ethanolamine kinase--aminoglycoside phosphotransferase [Methylorubrum populi]